MTWRESVTIDDTISLLNDALKLDPSALKALVEQRVPCNSALHNHSTIQTGHISPFDYPLQGGPEGIGLLGVINGLFGVDSEGWRPVSAVFDDDGTLTRFQRTERTVKA